jgi:hypothetical protein
VATKDGSASANSVIAKYSKPLTVPLRELTLKESLACGFRQEMLSMGEHGDVHCGAGLGTDFIILRWGERHAVVRASEILRAWVRTFNRRAAARFPDEIREVE